MKDFLKGAVVCIVVFIIVGCVHTFLRNKETEKTVVQLEKAFDEVDREKALIKLSEFRGRIAEIKKMYLFIGIQDSARKKMETLLENEINSFQKEQNYYLEKLEIFSLNASVGEICDEILSQIDNQIYKIRFDAKDE